MTSNALITCFQARSRARPEVHHVHYTPWARSRARIGLKHVHTQDVITLRLLNPHWKQQGGGIRSFLIVVDEQKRDN